jgi:hypothetical protein
MKDGQKPLHDMLKLVAHPVGSSKICIEKVQNKHPNQAQCAGDCTYEIWERYITACLLIVRPIPGTLAGGEVLRSSFPQNRTRRTFGDF